MPTEEDVNTNPDDTGSDPEATPDPESESGKTYNNLKDAL